jgi:hypothetical protein
LKLNQGKSILNLSEISESDNKVEMMEQFQCRYLINGKRCENLMYRKNIGDAFDFPECESCHEGWIAFQEEQRKDPKYYGCGSLNTVETQ